ncbi:MAG: hypothetical protein J3K34DRAFT_424985 [Monoraphidium minutum]|nr:MAG: hypothetical protein J3K34DRAFT_424985 [Monoraphidium minutum]
MCAGPAGRPGPAPAALGRRCRARLPPADPSWAAAPPPAVVVGLPCIPLQNAVCLRTPGGHDSSYSFPTAVLKAPLRRRRKHRSLAGRGRAARSRAVDGAGAMPRPSNRAPAGVWPPGAAATRGPQQPQPSRCLHMRRLSRPLSHSLWTRARRAAPAPPHAAAGSECRAPGAPPCPSRNNV